MKLLFLSIALTLSLKSYANTKSALDELVQCAALYYIATAIYVPLDSVDKITDFDDEDKKYIKSEQKNLKFVSEMFGDRAEKTSYLFKSLITNEKTDLFEIIYERKLQKYKSLILRDELFAIKMGSDYERCQSYNDSIAKIKKSPNDPSWKKMILNEIHSKSLVNNKPNDNQVGLYAISGYHWKYMNFITNKDVKDFLKKTPQ